MSDRIDKYLSGGLDRAALTPEERSEADTVEHVTNEARAFLSARPAPDLTASVMSRVAQVGRAATATPPHLLTRLMKGLWTTREVAFRFRPVYGVLAACAIVAALFSPAGDPGTPAGAPLTDATQEPQFFVQFRLEAAKASDVRLAGTFTNWQPRYELHETASGVWTITVPLPAGVHDYVFLVNGDRWVSDPHAQHVSDGFGGTNSRIALLAPDVPRS